MVAKKKRGQPAPAPTRAIARRLEQVRAKWQVTSLLDFHGLLVQERGDAEDFEVSYSAVRNYHYDRDPPISYLRRVSERFGVRLAWLVDGDGGMTAETHANLVEYTWDENDLASILQRHIPEYTRIEDVPRPLVVMFSSVVEQLWSRRSMVYGAGKVTEVRGKEVAEEVAAMMVRPWRTWIGDGEPYMYSDLGEADGPFEEYAIGMLAALLMVANRAPRSVIDEDGQPLPPSAVWGAPEAW